MTKSVAPPRRQVAVPPAFTAGPKTPTAPPPARPPAVFRPPGAIQRSVAGPPAFTARAAPRTATPLPRLPALARPAATIQRAAGNCDWCFEPGCNKGSVCRSTSANVGTYNARIPDQKHLSNTFGQPVSGKTHQMEHPFGYKVLAGPMHRQGQRASTPDTRFIEQKAPAYHEQYAQHRAHEGTGSSNTPSGSGLNSDQYREWQGNALAERNLVNAIAINQMTYAHQALPSNPIGRQQANNSYVRMVRTMGSVPVGTHTGVQQIPAPTDDDKFDMLVFRFQVAYKRDPTNEEQLAIIADNKLNVSFL